MAEHKLIGRYKLYKDGQDKLLRWLIRAARRHQDIKTIQDLQVDESGGITSTSRTWAALATAVSAAKVIVPAQIIKIAAEVITGREAAAAWYEALNAASDGQLVVANRRHAYFIGVLKNVYRVLQSTTPGEQAPQATMPTPSSEEASDTDRLQNLFELLQLDDTPSIEQNAPMHTLSESASVSHDISLVDEEEDVRNDKVFAVWCHLEDLNALRTFIESTWTKYAQGDRTVLLAGCVADTGFSLMRRAHEEFTALHDDLGEYDAMLELLGLSLDTSDEDVTQAQPISEEHSATRVPDSGTADLACKGAGSLVKDLLERIKSHSTPHAARPSSTESVEMRARHGFESASTTGALLPASDDRMDSCTSRSTIMEWRRPCP